MNRYDINARVSDEDREAWSHQGKEKELLRSALRAALEERCNLALQQQPADLPDFKLLPGQNGPKPKETAPGSTLPESVKQSVKLASGGVMIFDKNDAQLRWVFYGAIMEDVAAFLSNSAGRSVHDMTGLTGRYDFTLQQIEHPSRELYEMRYNWPVDGLRLDLKSGTYPGFKLIIDHIEKPSPN